MQIKKAPMGRWLLSSLVLAVFLALGGGAPAVYIVQTADSRFHFISGQVDVFSIPFHGREGGRGSLQSISGPDAAASEDGNRDKDRWLSSINDMSKFMRVGTEEQDETGVGEACPQRSGIENYILECGGQQADTDAHRPAIKDCGCGKTDHANAADPSNSGIALVDDKKSRIGDIFLTDTGYVVYESYRIPLTLLYATPFFREGVSIMASNKHFPYIINNTFVVIASVQINIYDIVYRSRRDITFNYVVYWEEAFHDYVLRGDRIRIGGRWHEFQAPVVAVFEARSCGGLFYMVRLFNTPERGNSAQDLSDADYLIKSENNLCNLSYIQNLNDQSHVKSMSIIAKKMMRNGIAQSGGADYAETRALEIKDLIGYYNKESGRNRFYLGYVMFTVIPCCFAIMIKKRNLKCKDRVAEGVYTGVFIDQPCLIYQVGDTEEPSRLGAIKHHGLVHILKIDRMLGVRLFCRKVVVTEPTRQYPGGGGESTFRDDILCFVRAIEFLHGKEEAHGRVCPENLRSTEHGNLKVQSIFDNPGWRSPEQIRSRKHRPTRADDVFSLGCVIHHYITGHHPFDGLNPKSSKVKTACRSGEDVQPSRPFHGCGNDVYSKALDGGAIPEIEQNILERSFFIRIEDRIVHDLVYHCLFTRSITVSRHPFFWDWQTKAELICDISDFAEGNSLVKTRIEASRDLVFRGLWPAQLDKGVVSSLGRKRVYDGSSLVDLIRIIRNTHRHYNELQNRDFYEQYEGRVVEYYTSKFPKLFMVLHKCKAITANRIFEKYY